MRLKRQSVNVTTGSVIVCDPQMFGDADGADAAVFRLWEGNGEFTVYTDGTAYFVDVDPRILKAKSRGDLNPLPGCVGVDSAHVGIYNLTTDRMHAADDALADGWAIRIDGLDNTEYVAWFEEKGTSKEIFRGVVGFGHHPVLLLNGDHGAQLQAIEDRIAKMFRLKGREKQSVHRDISTSLCDLHLDGCKDTRLRMMADSIKLKLPRRPAKRG